MDVVMLKSKVYKDFMKSYSNLVKKIEHISALVETFEKHLKEITVSEPEIRIDAENIWFDNYDLCTFLKVGERTLQRLRTRGEISYTQLGGRVYYTLAEIHRMMQKNRIECAENQVKNLIENHNQYVEQRRNSKSNE